MENANLATSTRDLATILFRRKWGISVILAVTGVASFTYVMFIRDNLYEVTAKLMVKIGHEQTSSPTVLGENPMMIVGQRFQDVNSEAGFIQSNDLLAQLVDELGLDKPGPEAPPPERLIPLIRYHVKRVVKTVRDLKNEILIRLGFRIRLTAREEAIAMLQKGLIVTPIKDSNVVIVQLLLPTRKFAAPILNTLVERYTAFRLSLLLDESASAFFETRVGEHAETLARAEQTLHEFETAARIRALDKQKSELVEDISDISASTTQNEVTVRIATANVERFQREMRAKQVDFASLGAFDRESFPGAMMLRLADLEEQLAVLNLTPTSNSELIRANRERFHLLVGMIASNLETRLAAAQKTRDAWRTMLDETEGRLSALHARETEWKALRRDVDVAERDYIYYKQKREEAATALAMQRQKVGNVEIIEHAIAPLAPAGIRKIKLLGMALAFGIVAALAWASLAEFFDHHIYDVSTVESRLGAPVIGVIPITTGRRRRLWSTDRTVLAGANRRE